jgi:hypothetical protein
MTTTTVAAATAIGWLRNHQRHRLDTSHQRDQYPNVCPITHNPFTVPCKEIC